jgi:hypothetical protein
MSNLNLEQQRKRAKDLHRAHAAGDLEAAARIANHLPRMRGFATTEVLASTLTLSEAQFIIAQEAGFPSWPKMKHAVEGNRNPFSGLWAVNLLKSQQHPVLSLQTATLQFDVSGTSITISHISVDASGREERATEVVRADGTEYPASASGHVGVAAWLSPRIFEVLDKQNGEVVGRGRYEVASDGLTLTIQAADQTLVFDRQ